MKPVALVVAIVITALLAACSSPPVIRLHSLLATPADVSQRDAGTAAKLPIDLGVINVPASVDQPQWLVRLSDDSLRLLEQEQWASPLRDELRAAIWHHLQAKFGAVNPHSAPSVPGWRVQIDIQRFESIAGKEAWIDAAWSITSTARDSKAGLACRSSIREAAAGDVSALAAAHRRAVTRLADELGMALQSLARGVTSTCRIAHLTPSPTSVGEGWGEGRIAFQRIASLVQDTLTPALSR